MVVGSLKAQHATSPLESQYALDWVNFLLAALLAGFGPFVSVHLASRSWSPEGIGLVLTVGGLAGLIAQIPAGELIDVVRSRRALIGAGTAAAALALLLFGLRSDVPSVIAAALIQGIAGSTLGPAIVAISLGLVGHDALAERLGRNQRFASVGGLIAAAVMGVVGYLLSTQYIFVLSAALWIPLLLALLRIRAADIHFGRSCGQPDHHASTRPSRAERLSLSKNHNLLIFAGCLFLFQFANASMLPLAGERLAYRSGTGASFIISALIITPQFVVALSSPWVGQLAQSWGRRPLLLIGFSALAVRALLFAVTVDPSLLICIQLLDGVSGSALGVLTALIVADLTNGTGRFNLAQGFVGMLAGIGATLSTTFFGLIVANFGSANGFLSIAATALTTVLLAWLLMPETKLPETKPSNEKTEPLRST